MQHLMHIDELQSNSTFGKETEKAIISLIFESPDFFSTVGNHLSVKHFELPETKYVFSIIKELWDSTGYIPTKELVKDKILKELTVDDDYEPIINLIDREPNVREIPFIRKELTNFAKNRAFGLLYSDEGLDAYENKDYNKLEEIFNEARRIADVSTDGISLFDNINILFERNNKNALTSGFPKVDMMIEGGGPAKGEILCWMAPTGVGKSILLPHSGIACMKRGCNVLHITLELSISKTALRYAGAISNVEIHKRFEPENKTKMIEALQKMKSLYKGDLKIYEFPPDEISVSNLYQLITQLRRQHNWHPDVVVIDYLELMVPRADNYNMKEHTRQKKVATELRGLAKNENVLVFTATQTNRDEVKGKNSDVNGALIGLNRVAESYGKMKPMDYVLSANQSIDEYNSKTPQLRLFFAKNRNGEKNKVIHVGINYKTFKMFEINNNKFVNK